MQDVQWRLQQRKVFGYSLHQYVPLFFCQQNPIAIYHYDTRVANDVYLQFTEQFTTTDPQTLKASTGIAADKIGRLKAEI